MRLYALTAVAVIFLTGLLCAQEVGPGDAPYVPTKLEWAALELQMSFGVASTSTYHVSVAFIATADGRTVECLITYAPTVSAATTKTERDMAQLHFDSYARSRRWDWLRINFRELPVLPVPY